MSNKALGAEAGPASLVSIEAGGATRTLAVAPGQTILQAAESQGLDLPHGCRSASCGKCRARLVEGEADMAMNFALDETETAQGQILVCQAQPRTPKVRLAYDL